MRTFAYVDGFNLYYRALRKTNHKWLDLRRLIEALLLPENKLETIRYYTARVSGRRDPDEPKRQHAYLRALQATEGLTIHYGTFLPKKILRPLVTPVPGLPEYVQVHTTEEKGSDVNLASHLLWDAFQNRFDVAVVVSKDTDLIEPIRIVAQELGKPVGLLCPDGCLPKDFDGVVTFLRHISPARLAAAQFPPVVTGPNGKEIHCPRPWRTLPSDS